MWCSAISKSCRAWATAGLAVAMMLGGDKNVDFSWLGRVMRHQERLMFSVAETLEAICIRSSGGSSTCNQCRPRTLSRDFTCAGSHCLKHIAHVTYLCLVANVPNLVVLQSCKIVIHTTAWALPVSVPGATAPGIISNTGGDPSPGE